MVWVEKQRLFFCFLETVRFQSSPRRNKDGVSWPPAQSRRTHAACESADSAPANSSGFPHSQRKRANHEYRPSHTHTLWAQSVSCGDLLRPRAALLRHVSFMPPPLHRCPPVRSSAVSCAPVEHGQTSPTASEGSPGDRGGGGGGGGGQSHITPVVQEMFSHVVPALNDENM